MSVVAPQRQVLRQRRRAHVIGRLALGLGFRVRVRARARVRVRVRAHVIGRLT